jgi:hypothetical protein
MQNGAHEAGIQEQAWQDQQLDEQKPCPQRRV